MYEISQVQYLLAPADGWSPCNYEESDNNVITQIICNNNTISLHYSYIKTFTVEWRWLPPCGMPWITCPTFNTLVTYRHISSSAAAWYMTTEVPRAGIGWRKGSIHLLPDISNPKF